jgi:lipid II:glycine glycyltransferase (peptidoglycan interpeptide bridge formation enzyme)
MLTGELPAKTESSATFSSQVGRLTAAEWSDLLAQFDDGSVYQTWAYGAIHWGRDQLTHVVLKRNGKAVAAAQVRVMTLPAIRKGIAYLRWGPLCRLRDEPFDAEILRRMTAALKEEFVERRGLLLRVIPSTFENDSFAEQWKSTWAGLGLVRNEAEHVYRTLRLDLAPPLDQLRKRLNQKWRNCLNSAERNGLTVTVGSDITLYDKFLAAYQRMMARKQFDTTVDAVEFRKMQLELPEPQKMRILLCEKDGNTLNAIVISGMGDSGIYLLGATTEEGLNLKGAYLLQWRAIEWLKQQGCRWYDLGGINPETNPGVFHFKSGMSGQDVSQLGTFEAGADWMNKLCLKAGAQAKAVAGKLRSWKRKSSPAPLL